MLTVKNIVKTYVTGGLKQDALKGVSVSFRENELVSILGHSGSGKTTLLNIIGGLDQYTSGDLFIEGVSTKKYKSKDWDAYRNHSIGFIFQSYNLITHQTILRNVELALTISGVKKKERKQRAIEALKKVGLGDHINKKPNQLSGGQMQRVAIARALINNPRIILADEPTGALDSETSVQVMNILKEVAKDRLVVMVTHNPELAKEYSTRIIQLKDGEIISDSDPYYEEITERKVKRQRNKSMSFFTAFSLSLNNLLTKKSRTILTAFAGSIGIIGIALILSVSTGFQKYIDKLQEDTLSTYPFTITTETANITNMMVSMMQSINQKPEVKGQIIENQIVNDLFAHIDSNNITAFKQYYDEKASQEVKDGVVTTKLTYDIAPKIYSKSFEFGVTRLHPTQMFQQAYSYMSTSFSNFDSVFQEMTTNYDQYKENYDVLAGKWPEKYNECILVLTSDGHIADYMLYQLGLRDPKQLEELITNLMKGKTTKLDNKQMTFTYDDFLNMKFALVPSSSLYKYNSQYNIYEDMSQDTEYMKDLINKAEEIKIVGIVAPKEGAIAKTLTPGIAYRKELTEHVIEIAGKSEIVKKQLENKGVDVFSNTVFKTGNEETKSNLNFKDFISVDEEMIKSAFKVNVSESDLLSKDDITKLISETTKSVANNINNIDVGQTTLLVGGIDAQLMMNAMEAYVNANYNQTKNTVDFSTDTYNAFKYYSSPEFETLSKTLIDTYKIFTKESLEDITRDIVKKGLDKFADEARKKGTDPYIEIPKNDVDTIDKNNIVTTIVSSPEGIGMIADGTTKTIKIMTELYVLQGVANTVSSTMAPLEKIFNKELITVDASKFANAFKFKSDEKEMQRVINTYMNGSQNATLDSNLSKLDYAKQETPKRMSFYFKNFEAKENFIKFLDDYNNELKAQGNEKDVIKYTDVTGILMGSVKTIVDAVSYVLIAFVAISLIVSSIMIGVITLISVMERTKEIGILRAIGASKKDVSRVFNVETFIIGLLAGLIGIGVSYVSLIPINIIIHDLTKIQQLNAVLNIDSSIILVIISVILTLIAGLIPARSASKKNPVEALRSE